MTDSPEKGPSVEPGSRPRGRHRERWILVFRLREVAGGGERVEFFRIHWSTLPNPRNSRSTPSKLAVMISVARDETVAADKIVGFYELEQRALER